MAEKDVQNAVRLWLSERKIINFRVNVGRVRMSDGRYFDTGLPVGHSDIYGVLPGGRVIFVEAKKGDWKPANPGTKLFEHEEQQRMFLDCMIRQGAIAGFARSVEELEALLRDGV